MGNHSTDDLFRLDENMLVKPGTKVKLDKYDTKYTSVYKNKEEAEEKLEKDIIRLSDLQDKLYAQDKYSLLIIFQAMDAAGKDGTIKHVMSGINPQGCDVASFKSPSMEELMHDYLWRINRVLPRRGMIKIFNRSHYEEVLVTRVHPEYVLSQNLPGIKSVDDIGNKFWEKRYKDINNFEKHLDENGTKVIKFFLHISKDEQKTRFLKRIDHPEKNWKFSAADVAERKYWDKYMKAYEDAITETSTDHAPWYIIPADNKWFMRSAVGDIIAGILEQLDLAYPKLSKDKLSDLKAAKELLVNE
jgi:PPK2 family polyphosphate:nucleotide phosphotransferase